jgi:hypothetical protein
MPPGASGPYYPWWFAGRPSDAPVVIMPEGALYETMGYQVDVDLTPNWIERLNDLPNVEIVHTCAGHFSIGDILYPSVGFATKHPEVRGGNGQGDLLNKLMDEDFGDLGQAGAWEPTEEGAGGYPGFYPRIICSIWSWVPRAWMTQCEYTSWWEQVIGRLEKWTPDLSEMVLDY